MGERDPTVSDEAVRKATGRGWREWKDMLDRHGAAELSHKGIVALVREEGGVEKGWWQQTVAVEYERLKGLRVKGETRDAGFQVGVQRTIDLPVDRAWDLLTSGVGARTWLGAGPEPSFQEGARSRLEDGSEVEVRVVRPGKHVRLRWQPEGWSGPSTIQARVEARGDRTVIGFHEEHLPDSDARERRRSHFREALARLSELTGSTDD